jgi:hypothetical protein
MGESNFMTEHYALLSVTPSRLDCIAGQIPAIDRRAALS